MSGIYWYNNAYAECAQSYPYGLHKYYDMFSFAGYAQYWIDAEIARQERLIRILLTCWNGFWLFAQPLEVFLSFFYADPSNW